MSPLLSLRASTLGVRDLIGAFVRSLLCFSWPCFPRQNQYCWEVQRGSDYIHGTQ
jgi:hypothetical protein